MTVIVKLGKDDVPYFHETVAFAAHYILGAVAVFFAAIVIDLRARAAGTGAVLPEIILFAELIDTLCRNMHVVEPDIVCFLILYIDGRIQTLRIKAYSLCQELPGPRNSFLLEIVAEGEVAQHLKVSAVAGCLSHVFQIAGTDTLLAGGHSAAGRDLLTGKPGLHRCHTGIDDQKRCVIVGHQ